MLDNQKSIRTKIYCLKDHNAEIRYIGKTSRSLQARLSAHINSSKVYKDNSYRNKWIRKCLQNGYKPSIHLLVEVDGDGSEEEKIFIHIGRQNGLRLVNTTDGGEGCLGRKRSREQTLKTLSTLKCKKFICIENNKTYLIRREAATELNISVTNLIDCLAGRKKSCKGYHFRYIDEIPEDPNFDYDKRKSRSKEDIAAFMKTIGHKSFICEQNNKIYLSKNEAHKDLGLSRWTIDRMLKKGYSVKGYTFKYVGENSPITNGYTIGKRTFSSKEMAMKATRSKPFRCIETGKIYYFRKEAAVDLGVTESAIGRFFCGGSKTVRGCTFEYINEKPSDTGNFQTNS